jgi:hypothetical protein
MMRVPTIAMAAAISLNGVPHSAHAQAPDSTFIRAAGAAKLIFEGTVLGRSGRNLSVSAVRVIRTSSAVGDFAHQTLTVNTADTAQVSSGNTAVFLTAGLRLGRFITVQELLRLPVSTAADVEAIVSRLSVADRINATNDLMAKALAADVVVVVTIDSTKPIVVSDSAARWRNEHAPAWRRAYATVTGTFLSGDRGLMGRKLQVLVGMTTGEDLTKVDALTGGDARILLAQRASRLPGSYRPGIDTAGLFFVYAERDVRPRSDSARLANLLSK